MYLYLTNHINDMEVSIFCTIVGNDSCVQFNHCNLTIVAKLFADN